MSVQGREPALDVTTTKYTRTTTASVDSTRNKDTSTGGDKKRRDDVTDSTISTVAEDILKRRKHEDTIVRTTRDSSRGRDQDPTGGDSCDASGGGGGGGGGGGTTTTTTTRRSKTSKQTSATTADDDDEKDYNDDNDIKECASDCSRSRKTQQYVKVNFNLIFVAVQLFLALSLSTYIIPEFLEYYIDVTEHVTTSVTLAIFLVLQTLMLQDVSAMVIVATAVCCVVHRPRFFCFCVMFTLLQAAVVPFRKCVTVLEEKLISRC